MTPAAKTRRVGMHKLNKISGYYVGPEGIFYSITHDEIFELEYYPSQLYRRGKGIVGRFYIYRTKQSQHTRAVITGMTDTAIRLGAL